MITAEISRTDASIDEEFIVIVREDENRHATIIDIMTSNDLAELRRETKKRHGKIAIKESI